MSEKEKLAACTTGELPGRSEELAPALGKVYLIV